MIITGKCRQNGAQLGSYLVDNQKDVNERVRVFEVKGTTSQNAKKAMLEMSLAAELTGGRLGLYHATINPDQEKDSVMTDAEYLQAIEILENELGFSGQNRVAVIHEKIGQDGYLRQHMHVAWQREKDGKLIASSHNYKKHDAAREKIEIALNHDRTFQSKDIKEILTQAYNQSKTGTEFVKKAAEHGYTVGSGYTSKAGSNSRDFCVVDSNGHKVNLSRQIKGVKVHEIKERLKDVEASLPKEKDLEGKKPAKHAENQKNRRDGKIPKLTKQKGRGFTAFDDDEYTRLNKFHNKHSNDNTSKGNADVQKRDENVRQAGENFQDVQQPKELSFAEKLAAFRESKDRGSREQLARTAKENFDDATEPQLSEFEQRLQAARENREDFGRELENK